MKKILMVCSCLALLLALSVPTFAADSVYGDWYINESFPAPLDGESFYCQGSFSSNGEQFSSISLGSSTIDGVTEYNLTYDSKRVYSSVNGWVDNAYRYLTVVSLKFPDNSASQYFFKFLNNNTSLPLCDGSTCPATDLNHDDICDDCGMAFTYNLRDDTTYMYNDVQLPIVPSPFGDKATYYTLYDDGTGTYTLVAADVRFWEDSGRIVVTEKGNLIYYAAASGDDEWSQFSTQTSGNWVHEVKSSDTVSWSSHIIHDFTTGATFMQGDVNFLPPLMELAGQALSGEMVKIGKTLTILVACGVGCLACLVVLSLFGKRSLIFHR